MTRPLARLAVVLAGASLVISSNATLKQNSERPQDSAARVVLVKPAPMSYPQLAFTAHLSSDVILSVEVKEDGTVKGVSIVAGHPVLAIPAAESARSSVFECKNCSPGTHTVRVVYSFRFVDSTSCDQPSLGPNARVEDAANSSTDQQEIRVSVIERQPLTCDPSITITTTKSRSWKCLYLWRCVTRYGL